MLQASREAENTLGDMSSLAFRRDEVDGNHSDSEDSMSSHRSYLSETFSPPTPNRQLFVEVCSLSFHVLVVLLLLYCFKSPCHLM